MTTHVLTLSADALCLSKFAMKTIAKAQTKPYLVSSKFGDCVVKGVTVKLKGWAGEFIADKATGTLYRADSGECLSASHRRIVGPYDGQPLKTAAEKFSFGTQPINPKHPKTQPISKPKGKRGRPTGGGKGPDRPRLSEDDERQIRAKKPGSTCCYVLTNTQCRQKFGIAKSTVDNIRRNPPGRVAA